MRAEKPPVCVDAGTDYYYDVRLLSEDERSRWCGEL